MSYKTNDTAIILFDGVCNFCNASVNFIIAHDKKNHFKFAAIQSKTGEELLKKYNIDESITDSAVLIENNKSYIKSTAVLRITKHLNGLYPLLYIFIIIPTFIRDGVYDFISRNRYKWFGKKESCMIPTEEMKSKFIF
jgi:predicted DCC family thiol-disulfide oxidoreductase YuxK